MASTGPAAVPGTMKAVRIEEYGDASKLKFEAAPVPAIQDDQLLVRIHYAGVNPIDWKIRGGARIGTMPSDFPLTLGQDFSGEIVTRGKDAPADFTVGERVFGFANGTYAEYAAAPLRYVAARPKSMDFPIAASLPTAGVTALQIIRDAVQARPGMRILIHGAAGSVGSFATQIAKRWGARVIGTATGEDIAYLRAFGNVEVIDYKNERFEDKVHDVDAVVDLVGGDTAARSYALLKKGGVLVSSVGSVDEAAAKRAGVRGINFVSKGAPKDLVAVANLVEEGTVKPRLGPVLPLAEAAKAQEIGEHHQATGKILLQVV